MPSGWLLPSLMGTGHFIVAMREYCSNFIDIYISMDLSRQALRTNGKLYVKLKIYISRAVHLQERQNSKWEISIRTPMIQIFLVYSIATRTRADQQKCLAHLLIRKNITCCIVIQCRIFPLSKIVHPLNSSIVLKYFLSLPSAFFLAITLSGCAQGRSLSCIRK